MDEVKSNPKPEVVARLIIECDITTGVLKVSGHISNKVLVMQMLGQALIDLANYQPPIPAEAPPAVTH